MPDFIYKQKRIYYSEVGEGEPLLLLHGNTASSKMFDSVVGLYKNQYKVILIDFLGHGRSERLEVFPIDLWYEEALQTIALLEYLDYKKVSIVGTSGGALVALNIGLERPDLINKIVADSFEGETALPIVTELLATLREDSKHDEQAVAFYQYCHGLDWEQIVDQDTIALCRHAESIKEFFHKPLSNLNLKVLLTASKEDEFLGVFCEELYKGLAKELPNGKIHLFQTGSHPAMMSNSQEFVKIVSDFLCEL